MNNLALREFFKTCVVGEIIQLNTTIMGSYYFTTKTEDQYGDSYYYGHYEKSIKLYMKIDAIGSNIILFDRNYFNDNNKELSNFLNKNYPLDQIEQHHDISDIESTGKPKLVCIDGVTDDKWFLLDLSSLLYSDKNLKRKFTFSKFWNIKIKAMSIE